MPLVSTFALHYSTKYFVLAVPSGAHGSVWLSGTAENYLQATRRVEEKMGRQMEVDTVAGGVA